MNLQEIKGIGPKTAEKLLAGGIQTFSHLAAATPEQLDAIVQAPDWRKPDYAGWIEQARNLAPKTHPHQAELQALVAELNQFATDLQKLAPDFTVPAFSPARLRALLRQNVDRFATGTQLGMLRDLQTMLEETPPEEFLNLETWKGLWFTLNYLVQQEAGERRDQIGARLRGLPGLGAVADLREMLSGTPPEEFLKLETWKGMWFIANYELQQQAQSLKQRLLGADE